MVHESSEDYSEGEVLVISVRVKATVPFVARPVGCHLQSKRKKMALFLRLQAGRGAKCGFGSQSS